MTGFEVNDPILNSPFEDPFGNSKQIERSRDIEYLIEMFWSLVRRWIGYFPSC